MVARADARAWWLSARRRSRAAATGQPEALPRLLAIAGDADQGPLMQANALGYLRNTRTRARSPR